MAPENLIANHECWHAENTTCDCPLRILPQLLLYRRVMQYVLRIGHMEMVREFCDRGGICHIATMQEYSIKDGLYRLTVASGCNDQSQCLQRIEWVSRR